MKIIEVNQSENTLLLEFETYCRKIQYSIKIQDINQIVKISKENTQHANNIWYFLSILDHSLKQTTFTIKETEYNQIAIFLNKYSNIQNMNYPNYPIIIKRNITNSIFELEL